MLLGSEQVLLISCFKRLFGESFDVVGLIYSNVHFF